MTLPLVLVHGFMGGSAQWNGAVSSIAQQRDVIALDLPGFGENTEMPVLDRIESFADWVIGELQKRQIARYHLLGHSMGGMIAQEIALRDAERVEKLILYATGSIGVLPGRFETIAVSKQRAREDGPVATARRISATWFLEYEHSPQYDQCAAIAECASQSAIQAGLSAMEHWDGRDNLTRIGCPTLILWGDQDRTYTWDQIQLLWHTIPNTNLAVIPNAAHALHAEQPDLFQNIINKYLA